MGSGQGEFRPAPGPHFPLPLPQEQQGLNLQECTAHWFTQCFLDVVSAPPVILYPEEFLPQELVSHPSIHLPTQQG